MDLYEMQTHIPYMLMVLVGLGMILQMYFGGLITLQKEIDNSQQEQFRRTVVLENVLNIEYSQQEINATSSYYDYDARRAILPVEFFVNEDPPDGELGYQQTDEGHCYIPRVAGLDGENYGFYLSPLESQSEYASDYRELECLNPGVENPERVFAPALLLRTAEENPRLPVRVYVYSVP